MKAFIELIWEIKNERWGGIDIGISVNDTWGYDDDCGELSYWDEHDIEEGEG